MDTAISSQAQIIINFQIIVADENDSELILVEVYCNKVMMIKITTKLLINYLPLLYDL